MYVNKLIYSMYTTNPDYIETDFTLMHEGDIIVKGNATIYDEKETITLSGSCNNLNLDKFKDKSNLNNNVIDINSSNVSMYYSCELNNFPVINRINDIINKNIVISLPKVKIGSDFSFDLSYDFSKFKCEMTPLLSDNKLGDIIVE